VNKTDHTEVQDGYILDDQIGFMLRLASQRHASIFQAHALGDLTPTQFSVLIRVSELGECSQNRLGRLVAMDVATIKGVVDRLKKKELLQLMPDETDKRRTLTEKAAELISDLHESGHRITEETLRPLSQTEAATLLRLLRKMS